MPLIHKVVKYRTEHLKNLKDFDVTLDAIDAKIEDTCDDADLIVINVLSATQ